jgi:prophage regulatory protein
MKDRFIFKPERRKMTGVSHPTWWRMEKRGEAPKCRQISPGRVAWFESELLEWMKTRPVSQLPSPKNIEKAGTG